MTCLEEMEKDPAAGGRRQAAAAAGGKAVVLSRDQVVTAYARTAVRRHPISGVCPVTDSSAPSVEKQWFGSKNLMTEGRTHGCSSIDSQKIGSG